MNRKDIVDSISLNIQNKHTVNHMLSAEAIMRALARYLGEDEEEWGLTGLFHDIDLELVENDFNRHGILGADIARDMGATEAMCHAILCHNEVHGIPRDSLLDKALFCADPLTGLIVASALVRPDKKLAGVDIKSLRKRFKEKRFAAGADREQIALCHEIGMELEDFLSLGLKAMQETAPQLGL